MSLPRPLATLAVLPVLVAGCWWFSTDVNRGGFDVYNYTEMTLDIYYVEEGREQKVYTGLDPGRDVPIPGLLLNASDCTEGDLVARDASGAEVARRTEPICNHEEWIIGTPPP